MASLSLATPHSHLKLFVAFARADPILNYFCLHCHLRRCKLIQFPSCLIFDGLKKRRFFDFHSGCQGINRNLPCGAKGSILVLRVSTGVAFCPYIRSEFYLPFFFVCYTLLYLPVDFYSPHFHFLAVFSSLLLIFISSFLALLYFIF